MECLFAGKTSETSLLESRIRPQHAQCESIFAQVIKSFTCSAFMRRTDKINIKEVFPRLALQRTRLDLGQVNVAQGKDTQGFEQRTGLVLQCEHNGRLRFALWFTFCR